MHRVRAQLSARHTALVRAEDAARLCRAAQPLAAIAASRYALGAEMACSAWGLGAYSYGSPVAASRCALGTIGLGAARPSAHMCSPGCARCLLGMVGMSKTSCALR